MSTSSGLGPAVPPARPHPAEAAIASPNAVPSPPRPRDLEEGLPMSVREVAFATWLAAVLVAPDVRPDPPAAPAATPAPAAQSRPVARPPDLVPELDAAVRAIASERALGGAAVGIAILDVDSGHVLASVNEH